MVQFSTDPGTDVFVRGIDAGERARKARSQIAVDAAIRRGLAQSFGTDAAATPPLAPQPVQAAPQGPAAPAPALTPSLPTPPAYVSPEQAAAVDAGLSQPPPAAAPTPMPRPAAPQAAPAPALMPVSQPTARQPAGDRYDPVLRELAGAEGGGAAALGIMQQQGRAGADAARRSDQLVRLAMTAFARGDRVTGEYFAREARVTLPPAFGVGMGGPAGRRGTGGTGGAVTPQQRALANAMRLADRWYGNDPEAAHRFIAEFNRSGDMAAAQAAGGAFSGKLQGLKPTWVGGADGQQQMFFSTPDGKTFPATDPDGAPVYRTAPGMNPRVVDTADGLTAVNPGTATSRPITGADGQQVQPAPRGQGGARAGGRPLDREVKRQMLVSAGIPEQEAALIAAGAIPSPAASGQIRARISAAVNGDLMLRSRPQAEKNAEIDRQYQEVLRAISPGRGAPAPASPAPAPTPTPAPTSAVPPRPANVPRGSQYSPSLRIWRTPDGVMLGEDGKPAA